MTDEVSTSSLSKEQAMLFYEQIVQLVKVGTELEQNFPLKPSKSVLKLEPTDTYGRPKTLITDSDFNDSEASDKEAPRKKPRTNVKDELQIDFSSRKLSASEDKPPPRILITDIAVCKHIRRCVYDFQHFGGKKHKELWRQLAVELGYRVFDVARIGVPALEDLNLENDGKI